MVDGGWSAIISTASTENKLLFFHGGHIVSQPYHFITAVVGGMFLSLASHGTDHLVVQRLMTARNASAGRKALIGSGFMAFLQFALFLVIGTGIWVHYGGKEINSNEVLLRFIGVL